MFVYVVMGGNFYEGHSVETLKVFSGDVKGKEAANDYAYSLHNKDGGTIMRCDNCSDIIHEDDFDVVRNGKRYCERCAEELGYIKYPHSDMCGCEICALKFERE